MPTSTHVVIRIDQSWSRVGTAAIEVDRRTGMRMLHIQLDAMAANLYIPVEDVRVLELPPAAMPHQDLAPLSAEVGHA